MKITTNLLIFVVLILLINVVFSQENLRGVNPKNYDLYNGEEIICDQKKIPKNRINDDYCDCNDGSDEPGTNACNNGNFWCKNDDWVGNSIVSSHVNDGICDCCDGSDEWKGLVKCPNTCLEKKEEELKKKRELLDRGKRGLIKRDAYMESARLISEKKREELDNAKDRLVEITQQISQLEIKKSGLEESEKIAQEINDLLQKDLSKPEEPKKEDEKKEDDGGPDDVEAAPRMTEEERDRKVAELKKSLGTDDHQAVLEEISKLRNEIADLKAQESRERQIEKDNTDFFNIDFGPGNIYAELYGKCFEHQTKEYTYKICFFNKVEQGYTGIGNWKEWKSKYNIMLYEGGATCWNGPTRQTTVYLRCGETENFTTVSEPSKCIYEATFETPAACSPEDVETLESEFGNDIQI